MTTPYPIQRAMSVSLSSTGAMRMLTVLTLRRATSAHVMRDILEMDSLAMVSYFLLLYYCFPIS